MTHQPPPQQFVVRDNHNLAWGAARSDWLDAFADLELEVGRCVARHCPGKNRNLSKRLDDLETVEPGPDLSSRDQARLGELIKQCRQLTHLRATIVHSHMKVGFVDNVSVALFSNIAGEAHKPLRHVALTEDQIASSTQELRRIAADLGTFA